MHAFQAKVLVYTNTAGITGVVDWSMTGVAAGIDLFAAK